MAPYRSIAFAIMAIQFEDYYKVLGVSRDATQDEIRSAFRKLARKHHPDVAQDKEGGEEKFKQINEAYEVLGNPEKRRKYDQLGANWKQGQDFSGFEGFGGGQPFGGGSGGAYQSFNFGGSTGFSDFFESLFGQRSAGRGRTAGDPFGAFGHQQGPPRPMRGGDIEADLLVTLDEVMNGGSRQLQLSRPDAEGGTRQSTVRVNIPRGVGQGQQIRLSGLGQPGRNGGSPGDLFLNASIARHPDFRPEGNHGDLVHDLDLAPWEAALGAEITVPTPHGRVKLKIPPGTQSGTEMRLRGKGLAKGKAEEEVGDLYVAIRVRTPESISDTDRDHWQALADGSDFRPRDGA